MTWGTPSITDAAGGQAGDRIAATECDARVMSSGGRQGPLERAAAAGEQTEAPIFGFRYRIGLEAEQELDEVEMESAVVGEQPICGRKLALEDAGAPRQQEMGQPELGHAAAVPPVEGTVGIGRRRCSISFEHRDLVTVVGQHHGGSHTAHAAARNDDVSHGMAT